MNTDRRYQSLLAAVQAGRAKAYLLPLLESLASEAEEASEPWVFAHRTLAELLLEQSPWRAALHARKLVQGVPDLAASHALYGLTMAMQGHYPLAISAYRRAVAIAEDNPWYFHNLGHLLDAALDDPKQALRWLKLAHEIAPEQVEVAASLVHCLIRLGARDEARDVLAEARTCAPRSAALDDLDAWLKSEDEPMPKVAVPMLLREEGGAADALEPDVDQPGFLQIQATLRAHGVSDAECERALAIYTIFATHKEHDLDDATLYAASVDYLLRRSEGRGLTIAALASRYGVSESQLRYRQGVIGTVVRAYMRSGD
ncbi:MAG: hypothetical protein Q8Q09_23160 [Deltaproteobacteria bacterium]|nr:hypothetical protein [Deltaproteobacteria bacterium]